MKYETIKSCMGTALASSVAVALLVVCGMILLTLNWNKLSVSDITNIVAASFLLMTAIIAVLAFHYNKKHQELLFQPYVNIHVQVNSSSDEEDIIYSVFLENNGVGTALIKSLNLYHLGELIRPRVDNYEKKTALEMCIPILETIYNLRAQVDNASMVTSDYPLIKNGSLKLGDIIFSKENSNHENVFSIGPASKFAFRIDYESVYGKSYTYDSRKRRIIF